jgi:hypothetical protein
MENNESTDVDICYQISTNTLTIGAPPSAFDPKYLEYLLEYLGIPKNATILFVSTEAPNDIT